MPRYDKTDVERRMKGAVDSFKSDLSGLRTGRANVTLLDPVVVEVYGSHMPLSQVATVSAPEPRLLSVQVWDRSNVTPVEKAIRSAGLGLNPITDGQTLRLPIPDLTEERRKELAKLAGQYADYVYYALRAYKVGNTNAQFGRNNAVMSSQVQTFSDADMQDIAAYIASLPGNFVVKR